MPIGLRHDAQRRVERPELSNRDNGRPACCASLRPAAGMYADPVRNVRADLHPPSPGREREAVLERAAQKPTLMDGI